MRSMPERIHNGIPALDMSFNPSLWRERSLAMDFTDAVSQFGRYQRMRGRSAGTERKYRYLLQTWGRWLESQGASWETASEEQIESCLEDYSEAHSRSTTALFQTCLRSFYRWAKRKRHVPSNPAEDLETISRNHAAPRALSDQRTQALLAAIDTLAGPDGQRNRIIVRFFLFTGLRLAELSGLDREDLDMDARTILVRHAKYGRQRIVAINRTLYDDLQAWGLPKSGPIFRSERGRLADEGISQMFRRIIQKKLGFPEITAHVLRHTHATKLRRCGADLRQIQTQLGHEHPETTAIYTTVYDSELHQIVNLLSADW